MEGYTKCQKRKPIDYNVVKIATHEEYKEGKYQNNIATIVVDKPINLLKKTYSNAACLPACGSMFEHEYSNGTGVRCWMSGWEETPDGFVQHKIDIPIYEQSKCNQKYPIELSPGNICANGEIGKDTTKFTGGAPLVCQSKTGHWHVVGLLHFGKNPNPEAFVNIHHHLEFITDPLHREN